MSRHLLQHFSNCFRAGARTGSARSDLAQGLRVTTKNREGTNLFVPLIPLFLSFRAIRRHACAVRTSEESAFCRAFAQPIYSCRTSRNDSAASATADGAIYIIGRTVLISGIVLLATVAGARPTKSPQRGLVAHPNVILITIDTLRADHVGCYGAKNVKTPTLDGLAADGVVFERAISQVPLTWPSHAAILTGTYPFQNGVQDFTHQDLPRRPQG